MATQVLERHLRRAVARLPLPDSPLQGHRAAAVPLPDNVICFPRVRASELNRPERGRALHHRHVLILALQGAVTVCVDDQALRLHGGEGLLVLPFQFHDYIDARSEAICWLFVTFEVEAGTDLSGLRYRPFPLSPMMSRTAFELVEAYARPREAGLCSLLLALLLKRAESAAPLPTRLPPATGASDLLTRVNARSQRPGAFPTARELALALGISTSHLRTRFRESCGVSLGRHLRRLQLEKACGLLRSSSRRVSEVGERCGFASIYSFSRAFRRHYGVSPLAYRKDARR